MNNNDLTIVVTLRLDEGWLRHQTEEELVEYLRDRMNSSLGFRGRVKRFSVRRKRKANNLLERRPTRHVVRSS